MSYKSYFNNIRDRSQDLFGSYTKFKSYTPVQVKRAELIKPYLFRYDAIRLQTQVDKHVLNAKEIERMYGKAFSGMRKINKQQLIQDTTEFYEKHFPKELMYDMFNLHHKRSEKLTYEGRSDENKFRYKILDKILDPVNRMIAENSNVKSMIMTRSMVQYFSMLMAYQKQVDPENYENMKNEMCGKPGGGQGDQGDDDMDEGQNDSGDGQNSNNQQSSPQSGKANSTNNQMSAEDILEKLSKDKRLEKLQEEITNDAKETISGLQEVIDDQEQEEMWDQADNEETEFDKHSIMELVSEFNKMQMNMQNVSAVIKKLLDKSLNYFTGKEDVTYENLFEASNIADIVDYPLLHPKLRKLFAEDIMVRDVQVKGKIDLYIDCSGSMGSYIATPKGDEAISGIDFAKSFAIKLIQMGLVNKIYPFENSVHPEIKPTVVRVSTLCANGGTTINNVVKHIEKEGRNALIITDAEDRCNTYSPLAFFIGILGCSFNNFSEEALQQYADKAQVIEFDGNKIFHINEKGKRIK